MTRKEKILAVLKSFEQNIAYDEGGITLACITRPLYERLAEVIIDQALDLDVPSDEEIEIYEEKSFAEYEDTPIFETDYYSGFEDGAKWMKQEIMGNMNYGLPKTRV